MSKEEFCKLLDYLMSNNSWKHLYDIASTGEPLQQRVFKYFRFSVDSRTGEIWNIAFSGGGNDVIDFRLDDKNDIERMYNYLQEDNDVY